MKLDVLLEKPRTKILFVLFVVSFALFFIFTSFIFQPFFALFPPGNGFNEMKFAWTKERMDAIIAVWLAQPGNLIQVMGIAHVIDFVFMGVYGTLLSTGSVLLARQFDENRKLQLFFLALFFVGWIAAFLDVIEGINIFAMLLNPTAINPINPFVAALSTSICVWMINVNLVLIVIGFVIAIVLYVKNRSNK